MTNKLLVLSAMLAVARAAVVAPAVTVLQPAEVAGSTTYDSYPQYSYSYSVADGLTGDQKAQEETRSGDYVQGSYSLVEPDGSRRRVSYASDSVNGFNAVVQRDPNLTANSPASAYRPAVATGPVLVLRQSAVAAANADLHRSTAIASVSPLESPNAAGLSVYAGTLYANQPVRGSFSRQGVSGLGSG